MVGKTSQSNEAVGVREQILAAATRLFAAHGYDGVPLQAIADAVGIRKASLLYHFPSKVALRLSVLGQLLSHWQEAMPRILRAATSGEGQFEGLIQELCAFFTRDPDRARLLVREALDRPDEMRALLEQHVTCWVQIICDHIRRGQEQGRVHREVDPEAYVVQVINLVIASVATSDCLGSLVPARGRPSLGRNIDELQRVAWHGLFCTREARPGTPGNKQASPEGE